MGRSRAHLLTGIFKISWDNDMRHRTYSDDLYRAKVELDLIRFEIAKAVQRFIVNVSADTIQEMISLSRAEERARKKFYTMTQRAE